MPDPESRTSDRPPTEVVPVTATVVIPAFNEAEALPVVLGDLQRSLPESVEIIVVDDGSSDATAAVAARHRCRVITHPTNRGKAEAVRSGIAVARAEKIVFLDGDGTYPCAAVSPVIQALDTYDLVMGSRHPTRQHIPRMNRFGNILLRELLRRLYGFEGRDPFTGLYGIRRAHLDRMRLGSTGFGIEAEICLKAARMGLTVLDVSIDYKERIGRTKLHPVRDGYRILRTILAFVLLYNPTLTFVAPGLGLLGLGALLTVLTLFGPIRIGPAAFGTHTTLVAATLGLVGFQVVAFGVATQLYGIAHHFTRMDRVTAIVLQPSLWRLVVMVAVACIVLGVGLGINLVAGWVRGGFGDFTRTQEAELVLVLTLFGVQSLFGAGFASIIAGDAAVRAARTPRRDRRDSPA